MKDNSNIYDYKFRGASLKINLEFETKAGIYGESFWGRIQEGRYESTTFDFLESLYPAGYRSFVDIGAATGCMSLFAAFTGLSVVAIEPQEQVFRALLENVNLNPEIAERISLKYALVSATKDEKSLSRSFTPGAAGPITSGALAEQLLTLEEVLNQVEIQNKVAIKIDIEGAEFPLFFDEKTINYLIKRKPLIFIALHPGFKKPLSAHANFISRFVWRLQALDDVIRLYSSIRNSGIIRIAKTNKRVGIVGLLIALVRDDKDFIFEF
jgi:FkbM family methyltransferase